MRFFFKKKTTTTQRLSPLNKVGVVVGNRIAFASVGEAFTTHSEVPCLNYSFKVCFCCGQLLKARCRSLWVLVFHPKYLHTLFRPSVRVEQEYNVILYLRREYFIRHIEKMGRASCKNKKNSFYSSCEVILSHLILGRLVVNFFFFSRRVLWFAIFHLFFFRNYYS